MPRLSKSNLLGGLRLIELVREFPELYDPDHELAGNDVHKNLIWIRIAEKLDAPVEAVEKNWEKLTTSYAKKWKGNDAKTKVKPTMIDEALAFLPDTSQHQQQQQQQQQQPWQEELSNENSCASSKSGSPKAEEKRSLRSSSRLSTISKTEMSTLIASSAGKKELSFAPDDISEGEKTPTNDDSRSGSGEGEVCSEVVDRHRAIPPSDRILRPRHSEPSSQIAAAVKEALQTNIAGMASRRTSMTPTRRGRARKTPNPQEPTRVFFESMGMTVATFPQHVQAGIKVKVCQIVEDVEYDLFAPKIR